MQHTIHRAEERGHANHGWLNSWHSFSFAGYYNPSKIHFGALRVINDDTVSPGMGFGTHPHENMEIITIPLEGAIKHADSVGNEKVLGVNEVQVMTAGNGIQHSEFNASQSDVLKFLQIWIFPDEKNLTPDYAQHQYSDNDFKNKLHTIVGGRKVNAPLTIHQNAVLSMGKFDIDKTINYTLSDTSNGLYVFIIEGEVIIDNIELKRRDAIGIWEVDQLDMNISKDTHVLLLEIPR
ncbi:pirin family protein [Carboxylicivirga linearis]|uniref:Pirin family protein n=1 Tax=Carboxylicivirga linearis TaxID=1628157 RepID=A0ABS5JXE2_9BACT|nr:pirin family protein [Carboxylicivirga linearis]MBS2099493.1 pirin family protein [Carboxylicivirga linearis]